MFTLNVSEILDFDTCPRFHHYRWTLKRATGEKSTAMRDGTYAHEVLELMLNGAPPQEHADWARRSSSLAPASERALNMALAQWWERYATTRPWEELLSTEEPLTLPRSWGQLIGTPDAAVIANGQVWHVQHKRIGQSIRPEAKIRLVEVSLHEGVYAPMLEARWSRPYGGTLLNLVRHMSEKRMFEDPMQSLHMAFLPRTPDQVAGVLADVDDVAPRIIATRKSDAPPYRNRSMCMGRFGNSPCEFYDVCWKGVDIQDPSRYIDIDPLERYRGLMGGQASED